MSDKNRLWQADPILVNQLEELKKLVANQSSLRAYFIDKFFDPRRNVDDECGYPKDGFWAADKYLALYEREPIANRAVQFMPKECWQRSPTVTEDEDAENITDFEQAIRELGSKLNGSSWHEDDAAGALWALCLNADVQSRIGSYGIVLIGIDDGKDLSEPVDGIVTTNRKAEPVFNSLGKRVGTRLRKESESAILPDSPIHPGELAALRGKLKQPLTANEARIVDCWEKQAELAANAVATTMADLTATMQGSIQGTDQQYFGVQFGPTEQPGAKPSKKQHNVVFMRAYNEALLQVVRYEWNINNPRFGMPVMYRVTLNDPRQIHSGVGLPLATVFVHWSRVVHIADLYSNSGTSKIFAYPTLMPILNPILDIKKTRGASAEAYWKNCLASLSLETHPQLGGDVDVDVSALRDMIEQRNNGLQRDMILRGMTAKTLSPQAVDPTPYIAVQIEAICIQLGAPVRAFKGAERGELASSQDDADLNDRVMGRCVGHCTPAIVVAIIDRLIMFGALPEPETYKVTWPDPESLNDIQKAQIGLVKTQAMAAYLQGGVNQMVPETNWFTDVLDVPVDKAQEWVDGAADAQEENDQLNAGIADEHGYVPSPPKGFQMPPDPVGTPGGEPPVGNEWSDAARAAALEARRAKAQGKEVPEHRMAAEHIGHVAHTVHSWHEFSVKALGGELGAEELAHIAGTMGKAALHKLGEVLERVPGARQVAHAVGALHEEAQHLAHAAIQAAIQRYGHGAVSAALGAGGFVSSVAAKAAGVPVLGKLAGPAAKYVGALPAIAAAEVGHQLGVVAPNTKLDHALVKAATRIYVARLAAHQALAQAGKQMGDVFGSTLRTVETSQPAQTHNSAIADEVAGALVKSFNEAATRDKLLLEGPGAKEFWSALDSDDSHISGMKQNAFCPTGLGGGVDDSCSPWTHEGGSSAKDKVKITQPTMKAASPEADKALAEHIAK